MEPLLRPTSSIAYGDLSTHPPAHLVLYAHDRRLTGTLELGPPGAPNVTLSFVGGFVRRTRGVHPIYLGGVLYELGFIDSAMLNATLRDVARRRRPHGAVLLERRAITRAQLAAGLREQTERRLTQAASLSRAFTWHFHPGADLLAGQGGDDWPDVSPVGAMWRAMRDDAPDAVMARAMACLADHPVRLRSSIELSEFGFAEDELALVLRMREPVRRSQLEELARHGERRVDRLLFGLLLARKLEVLDPGGHVAPLKRLTPPPSSEFTVHERGGPAQRVPTFSVRVPAPGHATSGEHQEVKASGTQMRAVRIPVADTRSVEAMREAIRLRAQTIAFEDHFQALGVARDATPADVRATFFRLARIWHPDRLAPELASVHDECVRVFTQLTVAYRTLTSPDARARYMVELDMRAAQPPDGVEAGHDPAADVQAAEAALAQGHRARAEVLAERALAVAPDDGEAQALVVWLEALRPENQREDHTRRSIGKLDAILESNPACAKAYFHRAMLHRRVNDHRLAVRDLRDVLSLQPRHEGAMRELRLFEMRIKNGTISRASLSAKATSSAPKKYDSIGEMVAGWLRRRD